jgi:hypothetical protein
MQAGWGSVRVAGMKNDSDTHRAYTPKEISGWIQRYRASGLGLGFFAEQHGLSRNRLHYWVYDRRYCQPRPPVAVAPAFQELKVAAGLPTQNWAAEIRLPTGAVARFTATATPAWINSVLEALRRPC